MFLKKDGSNKVLQNVWLQETIRYDFPKFSKGGDENFFVLIGGIKKRGGLVLKGGDKEKRKVEGFRK